MEECGEWLTWIDDVCMSCLDSETGDFVLLPWPGSLMEQPFTSFTVVRLMQGYYKRIRNEARKAALKGWNMADAKIVISAKDETKQATQSAKQNIEGMVTAASTGFMAATTAAGLLSKAVGVARDTFVDLAKNGINATDELRRFTTLLGSENDADSLLGAMDRLDDITLATKDDLSSFAQELIVMGKSQSEIQQILEATVHLSNTSGRNFTEVQGAMQRALSGSTTAIEKMMPELKELSKDAYDNGDAFKYMNDKLGEASVTIASGSFSQKLDAISTSWDRIKENIGATIVANIESTGILDSIYTMLGFIERNTANKDEYTPTSGMGEYWSDIFLTNASAIDSMNEYIGSTEGLAGYLGNYANNPQKWIMSALNTGIITEDTLRKVTGFNPNPTIKTISYGNADETDIYSGYSDDKNDGVITNFPLNWGKNEIDYTINMKSVNALIAAYNAEVAEKEREAKQREHDELMQKITDTTKGIETSVVAVGSIFSAWKDGYNSGDLGTSVSGIADIVSIFNPTWGNIIKAGGGIVGAIEGVFGDGGSASTSGQASVMTATYNGATTIHINNYFDGSYIVGSGGMAELAEIIGEELDNKAYTRTGR